MQTAISTIHTFLITIMTLAQYHDSLAEYPPVGIILANEGLKENIPIHLLNFIMFHPLIVSGNKYLSMSKPKLRV